MSLIELIMARDLTRYFFYILYHVIVTVTQTVLEGCYCIFGFNSKLQMPLVTTRGMRSNI